ncbi:MAG: hypothetical protein E6J55_03210 [Deltaproteobacteria bacterium]|nr:MAG: hypothetical protein E6J55_03210 [Deltaproteobacteria bacterium]
MWRGPVAALALLAGLAVTLAQGSEGDAERVVRYTNDQLTVRLARAPVGEVLDEIGRASGAEIRGQPNPREVSAAFEDVPLPDALHRLLGNQNFTLKYGEKGRLVAIDLLGGPATAPASITPAGARPSSTTMPTPPPQNLQEALRRHPPVPVTGALATALGTNAASVDQLLNTVLHHDDAGVRQEALRATLNAVESDAALRGSLLATVNTIDDAALGASLRGIAGDRAEELMAQVATQARASELRVKASSVLQQLRAQASAAHP